MRNILRLGTVVALLALGFVPKAEAQARVNPELLQMSELSERRIRQGVTDILGPEARAVVSVYFKEKTFEESASADNSKNSDDSQWELTGPYALSSPKGAGAVRDPGTFEIESAEVSVQIEASVDEASRLEIDKLAKSVLRGIPVAVKVSSSLKPSLAAQKASEASRSPASVGEDALEAVIKKWGPLAPLAAAFVLAMGVLFVGLLLRSSSKEIAEGLRTLRPAVSNSGSQNLTIVGSAPSTLGLDAEETKALPKRGDVAALPPPPVGAAEIRRNLQIVESYLVDAPLLFARSLGEEPADLMGLKFLVAKLSPESRTRMKELVGVERLQKVGVYSAGSDVVGFNAGAWLQLLIEKIELKRLAGGSLIEEALSNDESQMLSNANHERLFEVAAELNTPPAWRVATDFLPADFLKKRLPSLTDATWMSLVEASLVLEADQVKTASRAIIERMRLSVSENVVLLKHSREREDHFRTRLLPALVDSILAKDFGDDEIFAVSVLEQAPDFKKMLDAAIWTGARLDDVEEASLQRVFSGLDNEKRASLIFAFPERQSERLVGLLPEGNAHKISLDIVARLRASSDPQVKTRARALAREFLDYLRVESLRGGIELKKQIARATNSELVDDVVDEETKREAS